MDVLQWQPAPVISSPDLSVIFQRRKRNPRSALLYSAQFGLLSAYALLYSFHCVSDELRCSSAAAWCAVRPPFAALTLRPNRFPHSVTVYSWRSVFLPLWQFFAFLFLSLFDCGLPRLLVSITVLIVVGLEISPVVRIMKELPWICRCLLASDTNRLHSPESQPTFSFPVKERSSFCLSSL